MSDLSSVGVDWETVKENYVPVREGRKPTLLSPPPAAPNELAETRKKFWAEVANASSVADPLEPWLRFIKWTQDTLCAHGQKAELQAVLEACTKAIGSTQRYKNDHRYLRVWVQFADCLQDPVDVFLHLQDAGIGQGLALFYEAYATYLELKGSYERAGLVYQEGISRGAKPLERLQQKQLAFQQRMARRIQRKAQEETATDTTAADKASRSALAGLPVPTSRHSGSSSSSRRQPLGGDVAGGAVGVRHSKPAHSLPASHTAAGGSSLASLAYSNKKSSGLQVHVDDEFEAGGAGSQLAAFPPRLGHQAALPQLGALRKENAGQPSAWLGQRLAQAGREVAAVPAPKLEVLADDDEEGGAEKEPVAVPARQSLRHIFDVDGPAAAAQRPAAVAPALAAQAPAVARPKQQHKPAAVPGALASSSQSTDSRAPGKPAAATAAAQAADGKARASGSQGFDPALLVGADGSEQCFEEVRARAWRAKAAALLAAASATEPAAAGQPSAGVHASSSIASPAAKRRRPCAVPAAPLDAADAENRQPSEQEQHHMAAAAAASQQMRAAEPAPSAASAQPIVCSVTAPGPPPAASAPAVEPQVLPPPADLPLREPTVTLHMRAALDEVNFMFSDDLPTEGLGGLAGGLGHDAGEPTLTMGTRAAMDAVNHMFAGGGDTTTLHLGSRLGGGSKARQPSAAELNRRLRPSGIMPGDRTRSLLDDTVTMNTTNLAARLRLGGASGRQSLGASLAAAGAGEGGLGLYEDTEFVGQALAGGPGGGQGQEGAFQLYEDTQFATRTLGGTAAGVGSSGEGNMTGGFGLYEDTEFMTRDMGRAAAGVRPSVAAGGAGGLLYEDTEFLTRPMDQAARQQLGRQPAAGMGAEDSHGGALAMYQDTEYLTENVMVAAAAAGGALGRGRAGPSRLAAPVQAAPEADSTTRLLRLHKENLPVHVPAAAQGALGRHDSSSSCGSDGDGGMGLAVHADPFTVMGSPDIKAAGGSVAPSIPSPDRGPDVAGPKENQGSPHLCGQPPRHPVSQVQLHARALQPLAPRRAAELGVETDPAGGAVGDDMNQDHGGLGAQQRQPRALRSLFM